MPSSGAFCSLPTLPDDRYSHSADDGLLCGGSDTNDTCIQWSPVTGSWEAAVTLDVRRYDHLSWTPVNGRGTFLMGGYYIRRKEGYYNESRRTTTLITPEGTQEPGFPLKYDHR